MTCLRGRILALTYAALLWSSMLSPACAESAIAAPLLVPINRWVTAYNAHDVRFPEGSFTSDCTVIDSFPPFAWSTPASSVRAWYDELVGAHSTYWRDRVLKSDPKVVLGDPVLVDVRGPIAYLTFYATWMGNDVHGKRRTQHAVFTVVERKTANGWLIAAHAWGMLKG